MSPPGWRNFARGWRACAAQALNSALPYYFALLAETFGRAGLVGEALASLSTGFAFASKNGEEWAVAGAASRPGRSAGGQRKAEAARASFRRGVEAARRSGSLAFERRLSILADGTAASRLHRTLLERCTSQSEESGAEIESARRQGGRGMSLQQAITDFRGQFRGTVIEPHDAAYERGAESL